MNYVLILFILTLSDSQVIMFPVLTLSNKHDCEMLGAALVDKRVPNSFGVVTNYTCIAR